MTIYVEEVAIDAPIEQVFQMIADPSHFPEYVTACTAVRWPGGVVPVGGQYTIIGGGAARTGEVRYTVTVCEPPFKVSATFRGPVGGGSVSTTLETTPTGTALKQTMQHATRVGLASLVPAGVVTDTMRRAQRRTLDTLKRVVEDHAARGATA